MSDLPSAALSPHGFEFQFRYRRWRSLHPESESEDHERVRGRMPAAAAALKTERFLAHSRYGPGPMAAISQMARDSRLPLPQRCGPAKLQSPVECSIPAFLKTG